MTQQQAIEKAVNFWAGFLEDPTTSTFDNGDTTQIGHLLTTLVAMANNGSSYPKEEISKFKEIATAYMTEYLNRRNSLYLNVDYDPNDTLTEWLDLSITKYQSKNVFPCKTRMVVEKIDNEYSVLVRVGYGAKEVAL